MLQQKRLNVFNKTTGMLYRAEALKAHELVRTGQYAFVRKGKLKCFLNRERKLSRNQRALEGLDLSKGNPQSNKHYTGYNGRTYVQLGLGMDAAHKRTSNPGQVFVVRYPN